MMTGRSGSKSGKSISPLPRDRSLSAFIPNHSSYGTNPTSTQLEEIPNYPPIGLQNVGNTCYANAALQCLFNSALSHALLDPASTDIFRRYSSNLDILSLGSGSVDSDENNDSEVDEIRRKRNEARRRRRKKRRRRRKEKKQRRINLRCRLRDASCASTRRTKEKLLVEEKNQWLTRTLTDIARNYTAGANQWDDKSANSSWLSLCHLYSVSEKNKTIDPSNITRHVQKLSPFLRPYQQEDAHEFIRTLLSTLVLDGRNKQLSSLFDGLLESAVTCQTCHHASVTRDRYMDLSLEIHGSEVEDLVGALRNFTKTEVLDKDNKVHCAKCNTKRVVSKGLKLTTAPSILICHLKRFSFNTYGNATRLSKKIKYPLRLEIKDFMSQANQGIPTPYELVGLIVHVGNSCERGHYLSYIRSGHDWYEANDEVVKKVKVSTILNQEAYVLLYEIEGMRANHGYYGCGRYHLPQSLSSKTAKDTASTYHGGFLNGKLETFLDSAVNLCGAT